MDIWKAAMNYLFRYSLFIVWKEINEIFYRAAMAKPRHWRLPIISCESVMGECDQAIPCVAAIACVHISILLIDDMLDNDPRGEYHCIGKAKTANLASAFQALSLAAILTSDTDLNKKYRIIHMLNEMILVTSFGQHEDIGNPITEQSYWDVVRTKSIPFFKSALSIGAIMGGASKGIQDNIERLGCLYGEMIQIHDDLNDAMEVPANPDWLNNRASLPILYAKIVPHPEREHFIRLCKLVRDQDTLQEAQAILIRSGAVSYSVDQLVRRYFQARQILSSTCLDEPEGLRSLFEDVILPVRNLFEELDLESRETWFQTFDELSMKSGG